MPPQLSDEMAANFIQAGAEWPEQFTERDKQMMSAIDVVLAKALAEMTQAAAAIIIRQRQQAFNALLANRNGLQ